MTPNAEFITLHQNLQHIRQMLMELVLRPRRDLAKWARVTKQTPNVKIGYLGQHLASLVTGVEGERTGARGHDLRDRSEVKSCSRLDQLDKCKACGAAVARIEPSCPNCNSNRIKRKNDSKWLLAVKNTRELDHLLDEVPRIVFLISDYPNFSTQDWDTLRFQVFEIWPSHKRHANFRTIMTNYYHNIFLPHIDKTPTKTPAPKNFWPYSYQFYMCNPVRTFCSTVEDALEEPKIKIDTYVDPYIDRSMIESVTMPLKLLSEAELSKLNLDPNEQTLALQNGITESQRSVLHLRDTAIAKPRQTSI